MRSTIALIAATIALATTTSAQAASIADGTYTCTYLDGTVGLMSMGDMEIRGNSYRGPAYDGRFGASYDYELLDNGNVVWRGPLGGMTGDGNTVGLTIYEDDVFVIQLITAGGNIMFVTCS